MNTLQPVTKEEALKYDKSALEADVARRRRNIKLFEDGELKNKELAEIERLIQMIEIIENN